MRFLTYGIILGSILFLPALAMGQGQPASACQAIDPTKTFEEQVAQAKKCVIESVKAAYDAGIRRNEKHPEAAATAVDLGGQTQQIGRYLQLLRLTGPDQYRFLLDVQEARSDLQIGSSSGSKSATTSIVTKGTVPAVLGFAVEHGALERDVNGSSVTFRGTPVGLAHTFAGLGFQQSHDQIAGDPALKYLNPLSFAVTFDTSAGGEPGVLLANTQQVSAWSLRYQFVNHRDPRDGRYKKVWSRFLDKEGTALGISAQRLFNALTGDSQIKAWNDQLKDEVSRENAAADFVRLTEAGFARLENVQVSTAVAAELTNYMNAIADVLKARKEIRDQALKGAVATLDYSVSRDPNLPDLSDIRFVAATSAAGRVDLTFNAAVSFFNKETPTISNRIKAYEVSGQMDVLLGNTSKIGAMTLSAAWRFQKLPEDSKLPGFAGIVKKGVINTGQLKLTIPVKGTGMKIPLSFTAANRSELITEKKFLSANVGVTFDFDSILAKLTP